MSVNVSKSEALVLRLPARDEEEEFLRAHRATSPEVPNFLHFYEEGMPLARYLEVLAQQRRGERLSSNSVPSTFLFAFVHGRIVGRVAIRHSLNAFLERAGGHIGYVVVPEFRRRGYATTILRLALQIARDDIGLKKVLITCDVDNIASMRTIERNGGVYEGIIEAPGFEKRLRRYWIDLDQGPNDPERG